jgi:chorismate mutase
VSQPSRYSDRVNDEIATWREEIDRVDEQLLELFNRRAHCAIEIGVIKRRLRLPIDVPEREAEVVARVIGLNEGPLNADAIERLFESVIDESRIAESAMLEAHRCA